MLVIDDFGRQRVAPRDLLNRWIVPLESRVDYLTLNSGQKFELPFMTLVSFATNIRPQELVDEAFLRRIHYKVLCESPTHDDYLVIFRNYCVTKNVPFDRNLVEDLLANYYKPRNIPLRGCHPRDLIEQSFVACRIPRPAARAHWRAGQSRVRQLLRGRVDRGDVHAAAACMKNRVRGLFGVTAGIAAVVALHSPS